MKCPIDGNSLTKTFYEETVIDKCSKCEGVWLDKGELEKIQNTKINNYKNEIKKASNQAANAYKLALDKSKKEGNCPICDTTLERKEYGYASQILIDSCVKGHGIWLDKNELKSLEIFYEKSRNIAKEIDVEIKAESEAEAKKGFLGTLLSVFN